jgi:CHRD domain
LASRHDARESGINPALEFPFAAGVQPEWAERQYGREVGEDVMKKAVCLASAMLLGVTVLGVTVLGVTVLGVTVLSTAADAEVVKLTAELKGGNEVPPNNSSGSGKAEATFDTDSKVLTYTVTYSGLSGPALGAHFHGPSEPGKNAGISLPFKSAQSPIEGTATLTDAQAADLLAGKWYANVHTAANPGGELRGQMAK